MANDGKSIETVKESIELQLKQHKQRTFEGEFKKKLEELHASEAVFLIKKEEIENMMLDNEHLYK